MKKFIFTGAFILSSIFSFNAIAQMSDEDAAAAIERRQSVMQVVAFSNGPIGQMMRGADYNAEAAMLALDRVEMVAAMIPQVFGADTRGSSATTRSNNNIWDSPDDYAQLAQDLADGAGAAREILASQGAEGIRAAGQQVGSKCGACHDRFRSD